MQLAYLRPENSLNIMMDLRSKLGVKIIFHGQMEHSHVRARDRSVMAGRLQAVVCFAVVQEDI